MCKIISEDTNGEKIYKNNQVGYILMKQFILLLTLLFLTSNTFAETGNLANPQSFLVGARAVSLGSTSTLEGEISSVMLNPATLTDINELPITITSQQLYGHFNYIVINTGIPQKIFFKQKDKIKTKKIGLSASYARVSLSGIPEVKIHDDFPYQVGSYDSGFNIIHIGGAYRMFNKYTLDKISVGAALKTTQMFVGSSTGTTFGIDLGLTGVRYINNKYIDKGSHYSWCNS